MSNGTIVLIRQLGQGQPPDTPRCAQLNPKTIDNDPVMNKVLSIPFACMDILVNIYNSAVRMNTLQSLVGTKLYRFFMNPQFQQIVKSGMFKV